MPRSAAVDGFQLAYERAGVGRPVVCLHGWPGGSGDWAAVVPLLGDRDVVVPDLRGFGESDRHPVDPAEGYGAGAQAASVAGLITELGLDRPVVAGYDVGSRVAQRLAADRPGLVSAIVVTPPGPGVGERVLEPDRQREYWYQAFHRLELATALLDGHRDAVRAYLDHFWDHWSAPAFRPDQGHLDRLADSYGRPGALAASIAWYRAGAGTASAALNEEVPDPADRVGVPTTFLWPELDPLFPPAWADRLGEFFVDVDLRPVAGSGHFVPLEAPEAFAAAVLGAG